MAMPVNNLAKRAIEKTYHNQEFRNVIENHLQILRNSARRQSIEITAMHGLRYKGDFYGLLHELLVKEEWHWITLRLNGYHSPMDFQGDREELLLPQQALVEFLLRKFVNQRKYV